MTPREKLLEMLTWKRPHDSQIEKAFCEKYIIRPHKKVEFFGPMSNIVVTVGENSKTLFSCHTDTIHTLPGSQIVTYDPVQDLAYKDDGECLGADDTTGVWLMLEMIEANIPGTYIFHRGEERGCIGSHWLAANMPEWLKQFKRAIAFDRKEETSVITKQRGRTCCSSTFACDLAAQLGPLWKEDPTGSSTDTACYTHIIPECTNLSVGYYNQHGPEEMQNIGFALNMATWCIHHVDWELLPTVRAFDQDIVCQEQTHSDYADPLEPDLALLSVRQLQHLCHDNPEYIADALFDLLHTTTSSERYVGEHDLDDALERLDEFETAFISMENTAEYLEQSLISVQERLARLENPRPTAELDMLEAQYLFFNTTQANTPPPTEGAHS